MMIQNYANITCWAQIISCQSYLAMMDEARGNPPRPADIADMRRMVAQMADALAHAEPAPPAALTAAEELAMGIRSAAE